MAELAMSHTSRPGHHGAPLSEETAARLAIVAEAMIPPAPGWPGAGALVPRFVSERTSAGERDSLEALLAPVGALAAAEIEGWLRELEASRPESFAELRGWVYFGYYASGSVTDVLEAASGYHGAPQPLGYEIERAPRLPSAERGSYRRTEEVVAVQR